MDAEVRAAALQAKGFMPAEEGFALYEAAKTAPEGWPFLEIGGYCGRSALFLAAAAAERGVLLFSVDHHRGSEENQPGWEWHDPDLVDWRTGLLDTLPHFRANVFDAGLEGSVVAVVGDSAQVGAVWRTPLALLFIDGGHSSETAWADYENWTPHVIDGGLLAIHDVFPNPADGGRPPYEIYRCALSSNDYLEVGGTGSLRVLRRLGGV